MRLIKLKNIENLYKKYRMEGVIVLETPELTKTIDEINLENRPKIISKSLSLITNIPVGSLQEKLVFFSNFHKQKVNQEFS